MSMEIDDSGRNDQSGGVDASLWYVVLGDIFDRHDLIATYRDIALFEFRGVGVEKHPARDEQIAF